MNRIVEADLRTDMSNTDALSGSENLFAFYLTILRRNGMYWVLKDNPEIAVRHKCDAMRHTILRKRGESDKEDSRYNIKKDVKAFRQHVIKLAEALQIVDNSKPTTVDNGCKRNKPSLRQKNCEQRGTIVQWKLSSNDGKEEKVTLCLCEPCRRKGLGLRLKDYQNCPSDKKMAVWDPYFEKKEKSYFESSTPAQPTRSKTVREQKTNGRTHQSPSQSIMATSPLMEIRVEGASKVLEIIGGTDDGSEEWIVLPRLTERFVLNGIGKIKPIDIVTHWVPVKTDSDDDSSSFPRTWTSTCVVL